MVYFVKFVTHRMIRYINQSRVNVKMATSLAETTQLNGRLIVF